MKKEMSSFDVYSMVVEMSILEGSHIDKIFHWEPGNILFRLNTQNSGKKELFLRDKKWLYFPKNRPEVPTLPTPFASFLRKYIDNARVGEIRQIGFDRIVEMELHKSNGNYKIIFEIFGGGNVLLIKDGMILNCLVQRTWRDRSSKPGEEYHFPKSRFDPTIQSKDDFIRSIRASNADIVRSLATSINLGGQFAEEICTKAKIEKNIQTSQIPDKVLLDVYSIIKETIRNTISLSNPTMYIKNGEIEDFAPIELVSHGIFESSHYKSMSDLIDAYLKYISNSEKKNRSDPLIEKLETRISRQKETINAYKRQCDILGKMAEAIYTNYKNVNDTLNKIKGLSHKLTWEKLKENIVNIPFVTDIDPSTNKLTGIFDGVDVVLDYNKGLDANASEIYDKKKVIMEKSKRAEQALDSSLIELKNRQDGLKRDIVTTTESIIPTKQFWFERYKWFITSGNRLVIAGRDAHTNDNIVKKHLKDGDIYVHTDIHGAPSVVIKDGSNASNQEIREACQFALAQSKAWVAKFVEGNAFWVYPDQVSKTPNPGEFVPRGAFIIRGRRNYEYHLPIELLVGEVEYQGARKIMCGPPSCFKTYKRYLIIHPEKQESGRRSSEIAKQFQVPEEEISRILPPGGVEIVADIQPQSSNQLNNDSTFQ